MLRINNIRFVQNNLHIYRFWNPKLSLSVIYISIFVQRFNNFEIQKGRPHQKQYRKCSFCQIEKTGFQSDKRNIFDIDFDVVVLFVFRIVKGYTHCIRVLFEENCLIYWFYSVFKHKIDYLVINLQILQ